MYAIRSYYVCTPAYLASQARRLADAYPNLSTKVIGEQQMAELNMNSYLAVARGSDNEAMMSVVEYKGHPDAKPIVLIGKGLTFDSGGISIKPAENMEAMKGDMAGAAAAIAAVCAIARLGLPIRVTAVVPATENLPSGTALKPGDILRAMSGKIV